MSPQLTTLTPKKNDAVRIFLTQDQFCRHNSYFPLLALFSSSPSYLRLLWQHPAATPGKWATAPIPALILDSPVNMTMAWATRAAALTDSAVFPGNTTMVQPTAAALTGCCCLNIFREHGS